MHKTPSYHQKDVEIVDQQYVYQGFLSVQKVVLKHRLFNQQHYSPRLNRELIVRKDAAGVLIYNHEQQRFLLIEQFRVGAMQNSMSPWQLEIVAGVLDGNESPIDCIERESLEEAGCQISKPQHLFTFYPSAGACSERFHLYVAQANLPEDGKICGLAEEGEDIKLHIFEYTDIPALFSRGDLRNAPVIMALQWLQQQLLLGNQ